MQMKKSHDALKDLRSSLEWLKSEGLLLETDKEVNGDLEITGVQKHLDGSIPILFNNVKGYPHLRAVTNLFGNMSTINKMFGWADDTERTRALAQALTHPIPSVEIGQAEAPVQEFNVIGPNELYVASFENIRLSSPEYSTDVRT